MFKRLFLFLAEVYNPKTVRLGIKSKQYFEGDCNNKTVQTEIKKKFLKIFKKSLYGKSAGGCTGIKLCKVDGVVVRCGKVNLTLLDGSGNRRKRYIGSFPIIIEFFVTATLNETSENVNEAESRKLKESLPGIVEVKKTMEELSQQLNNGQKEDVVIETKKIEYRCDLGQFLKEGTKCGKLYINIQIPGGFFTPCL